MFFFHFLLLWWYRYLLYSHVICITLYVMIVLCFVHNIWDCHWWFLSVWIKYFFSLGKHKTYNIYVKRYILWIRHVHCSHRLISFFSIPIVLYFVVVESLCSISLYFLSLHWIRKTVHKDFLMENTYCCYVEGLSKGQFEFWIENIYSYKKIM